MEHLADNLWIFDGDAVPFLGLPFSTRMTVVRLSNGGLWVHSPIKLTKTIKKQLQELGQVDYLIAPNHLHHLFLAEWIGAYPQADVFGTNEVIKKRDDLSFHDSLNSKRQWAWVADIDQELVSGSPLMEECVFYHKPSGTLIVTDLVENFSGDNFSYWQKQAAKVVGILAPKGKTPLDWRLSFLLGKAEARRHMKRVLAWNPQTLIMAHGEIVRENTGEFLARSFKWLVG